MAAGKSTIAKSLAPMIKADLLQVDVTMEKNNLTKTEDYTVEDFLNINKYLIQEAQALPGTVVIEGNFYYQEQIDDLRYNLDPDLQVFTLQASLQTCLKRNSQRKNPYTIDAVWAVYKLSSKIKSGINIETDNKGMNEVCQEIFAKLT